MQSRLSRRNTLTTQSESRQTANIFCCFFTILPFLHFTLRFLFCFYFSCPLRSLVRTLRNISQTDIHTKHSASATVVAEAPCIRASPTALHTFIIYILPELLPRLLWAFLCSFVSSFRLFILCQILLLFVSIVNRCLLRWLEAAQYPHRPIKTLTAFSQWL